MRHVKRTIRVLTREAIAEVAPPTQWIEPELCKLERRIRPRRKNSRHSPYAF